MFEITKHFPFVLSSWQTTGHPSGRPWLKLLPRVSDICSEKVLMYFKVFHSLGFGQLRAPEDRENSSRHLCLGQCACSLETAWLCRLFIHLKRDFLSPKSCCSKAVGVLSWLTVRFVEEHNEINHAIVFHKVQHDLMKSLTLDFKDQI